VMIATFSASSAMFPPERNDFVELEHVPCRLPRHPWGARDENRCYTTSAEPRRHHMTANEIARVQSYLRRALSNERIAISPPDPPGAPVEMTIAGEQFGVLYRDDDEGEVSFSLVISILEEDLPPVA